MSIARLPESPTATRPRSPRALMRSIGRRTPPYIARSRSRILILDSHPIARLGLQAAIATQADLTVVGMAHCAPYTLRCLRSDPPDAAILELSLNWDDGLRLIKAIRSQGHRFPILVLSGYDDMLFAQCVLRAGGNGYVSKVEPTAKILDALRQVLLGKIAVSGVAADGILERQSSNGRDPSGATVASLTDRELQVFQLIGKAVSGRQIAERLGVSVKTVEAHRENIKRKLGLQNAAELLRSAVLWSETPIASKAATGASPLRQGRPPAWAPLPR